MRSYQKYIAQVAENKTLPKMRPDGGYSRKADLSSIPAVSNESTDSRYFEVVFNGSRLILTANGAPLEVVF